MEQFRERLAKFGLELHADKTRLIEFGRNAARHRKQRGEGKPETFPFPGFTHYCGKRRSNGSFIVWRKTAKKRMVAKLHAIKAELIRQKHEPTALVGKWLFSCIICGECGGPSWFVEANAGRCRGSGISRFLIAGLLSLACCILTPAALRR